MIGERHTWLAKQQQASSICIRCLLFVARRCVQYAEHACVVSRTAPVSNHIGLLVFRALPAYARAARAAICSSDMPSVFSSTEMARVPAPANDRIEAMMAESAFFMGDSLAEK